MSKQKDEIARQFRYLAKLRASGRTNMLLAPSYLVGERGLTPQRAQEIWSAWMELYDAVASPDAMAEKALKTGLL